MQKTKLTNYPQLHFRYQAMMCRELLSFKAFVLLNSYSHEMHTATLQMRKALHEHSTGTIACERKALVIFNREKTFNLIYSTDEKDQN